VRGREVAGVGDRVAAGSSVTQVQGSIVTVTLLRETMRCAWCGRRYSATGGPGRPRRFCRRSCRQRSYEARRRSAELGLGDHELVLTRRELETAHDRLYVLACAIDDYEQSDELERARALDELLDAARIATAGFSERTRRAEPPNDASPESR
jgi:hypothetical protein